MASLLEKFRSKMGSPEPMTSGVFGLFDTPEDILEAAEKVRDSKYTNFDIITPFPIHGMDEAMGLERSKLPWVTFFCGLTGATAGFTLQTWMHSSFWELNIGGKPLFSWPAYVPITFELTVLFGAHLTVAAFWIINRFPNTKPKILHPDLTHDKYAVWIPASSNHFNTDEVKVFLGEIGAKNIEVVES